MLPFNINFVLFSVDICPQNQCMMEEILTYTLHLVIGAPISHHSCHLFNLLALHHNSPHSLQEVLFGLQLSLFITTE